MGWGASLLAPGKVFEGTEASGIREPGAKRGSFLSVPPCPPPAPATPLPPALTAWGAEVGWLDMALTHTLHPILLFVPSLVSCEIDNHAAKPLAASLVLCPALEEIL